MEITKIEAIPDRSLEPRVPSSIEALIGKPLTATGKDGRKQRVGTIKRASIDKDGVHVTSTIEDESLKRWIIKHYATHFGGNLDG